MKVIADIIEGKPGAADKAFAEGFHVAGERYVVTKIEDRSLYGRLVRLDLTSLHPSPDVPWG